MKVYVFESAVPDLFFIMGQDGNLLGSCGLKEAQRRAKKLLGCHAVEWVEELHDGVKAALLNNKLRARFSDSSVRLARAELFRWQHGCLPTEGEARALNIHAGAANMVVGIAKGEVSLDSIAAVVSYMLSMLPEQEETRVE